MTRITTNIMLGKRALLTGGPGSLGAAQMDIFYR